MCLEPSELYILHKLNKMAVSTPKIPWVPMFLFFLNYYYYWLCFSDSLWQRRGSEVPSSELYIKPWAGFILSWVFWERSSDARITQKMFETIKNPYKTQKSLNRKEVTGSRYTLLHSFLNELNQTYETFASWDITSIWWRKVTCHALTFTCVSVAWVFATLLIWRSPKTELRVKCVGVC